MKKNLDYYLALDYPVEIRKIEDRLGGGFVATIPSLGAQAFVGDGDTPQEAWENLMEAKKELFAEYLEAGTPIPEPAEEQWFESFSGKLVLRMPKELHARLTAAAKANDVSLNQYIVYALSTISGRRGVLMEMEDSRLQEVHAR